MPPEEQSAQSPDLGQPTSSPVSGPALQTIAVQAFYDAKTAEERKAAAAKYPVLRQLFSASYFD